MRTELKITVVAIAAILVLSGAELRATSAAAPAAVFDEAACPMEVPIPDLNEGLTCGFVEVAANRASSDERTMRIAVAVYEATGSDAEPDPLVFLPGGPAAPLLEFSWFDATIFERAREKRDLVFFDHRGSGYSEPNLECTEIIEVSRELLGVDLPDAEEAARYEQAWAECLARLGGEGVDFHDFNTTEVASDVAEIVDALGYQDFNVYGASYGTAVGQYLLRDHGGAIRSAVLDSVVPLPAELFAGTGRSFQDALYTMFADCAADASCSSAYPDLENMYWDRVINQGNLTPFSVEVINPDTGETVMTTVDGFDVMYFTFVALYDTNRIPSLPRTIHEIANGDTSSLGELAQLQFAFEDIPDAAHTAVYCNEEVYFTTADDLRRGAEGLRGEIYAGFVFYPDGVLPILDDCRQLGIEGPRAAEDNLAVASSRPALVLSGQYDPITPPHYAEQVAASLPNNYYFEFRGTGHGAAYGRSACAMEVITSFLDSPSSPPDAGCVEAIPAIQFELPDPAAPVATPTAVPSPAPVITGSISAPDTGTGAGSTSGVRAAAWVLAVAGAMLIGSGGMRRLLAD